MGGRLAAVAVARRATAPAVLAHEEETVHAPAASVAEPTPAAPAASVAAGPAPRQVGGVRRAPGRIGAAAALCARPARLMLPSR